MTTHAPTSTRREFLSTCAGAAVASMVTLPGSRHSLAAQPIGGGDGTILEKSAMSVAALLKSKQISPTELADIAITHLQRIEPILNALIHFPVERVKHEAELAESLIAKGDVNWDLRPLTGVPITVKDCLDVAGMPTTSGVPKFKANIATEDATVVQRLRDAGAIVIGKTNLPALMSAYETGSAEFGTTNNPYELKCTPGGSSGGEAAILAAGGAWLGVGTDGLGSIRVPAHYCGIAGLRPGWGRVSRAGQVPPVPESEGWLPDPGLTTTGPFARSVADLHVALSIMQGPDPRDPKTFPVPLFDYRDVQLTGMKVAYWTESAGAVLTPETERTLEAARRALERRGAKIVPAKPPLADRIYDISQALYAPLFLEEWEQILKDHGIHQLHPIDQDMLRGLRDWHRPYTDAEVNDFQLLLPQLRTGLLTFLCEYDAIISPVTATPAPRHATTFEDIRRLVFVQLPAYLPAIPSGSVPCGMSDAAGDLNPLPIGVQVIARQFREDTVLAVMQALEDEFGGWQPPPALR